MENRFDAVNKVYIPYVKKHLSNKLLQNILVTGGLNSPGWYPEIERHKFLTYEKIFHFEFKDYKIKEIQKVDRDSLVVKNIKRENIFFPKKYIESVNLIYADVGGGNKIYRKMMEDDIEEAVIKILDNGFINNNLGILVFLFFDGIGVESFLDKQYGEYKSKDFFSKMVEFDDGYGYSKHRLDGVVFYE